MPEPTFYTIDPLVDNRWDELVSTHPDASIFHHSGWMRALARTYGFRPIVLTCGPDRGPLTNGIPFCEVRSWITGARLVSLPFSDHCDPLLNGSENLSDLVAWVKDELAWGKLRYVEFRPLQCELGSDPAIASGQSFWLHTLDLQPPLGRIFEGLHKDSLQRRIRRAEREGLNYEKGLSSELLQDFYTLLIKTRMRHALPPQPLSWFTNIAAFLRDHLQIRVARKGEEPIAAILTLVHGDTVVYKYGCSDQRFHNLAGMPFLFWKLIEESNAEQMKQLDFGRTDIENSGLTRFKDQFGAERRRLTYLRCRARAGEETSVSHSRDSMRRLFSRLPATVSCPLGALLYRHFA